jgi:molybdopterin-guanine dinucleotide biosynthesis protein A
MADPGPGEDAVAPLRACLLSGGQSRRMGRDKALLPHPDGGTWLEASLRLLAGLGVPLTLLTRHRNHLEAAAALAAALAVPLEGVEEAGPWEGPLLALERLMERHPGEQLLLCPVDMPWLEPDTLRALVAAAALRPDRLHAAHDGVQLQPLLGIYPADPPHRAALAAFTTAGGRSLQRWLQEVGFTAVPLPAPALRNANHPHDLETPSTPASAPG